jgi:hypothetical protein
MNYIPRTTLFESIRFINNIILNLAIIAMARAKKIQQSTKSSSRNSDANGDDDSNNNDD